jgi:hypothetical protein
MAQQVGLLADPIEIEIVEVILGFSAGSAKGVEEGEALQVVLPKLNSL